MTEVKVLMVGPKGAGKSALSNFIADAVHGAENPKNAPTVPTKGVRIVEFDRKIRTQKGEVSAQFAGTGLRAPVGRYMLCRHLFTRVRSALLRRRAPPCFLIRNHACDHQESISVELWDVSGDRDYMHTWPAIKHGGMGVVYVYDAAKVGEEKTLDQW